MITVKNIIFKLFICIIVTSCEKQSKDNIRKLPTKDTIFNPISTSNGCTTKIVGYYEKYGVTISNFYKYSDSQVFDYDDDGNLDSLAILRPFYFNNNDLENDCGISKNDNVLIISKVKNGKIINTCKFFNILSDNSSFLGMEEINISKNSFSINGDWGHSNKFYSKIYISYKKRNFFIDSINIESNGIYNYNKTYNFKIKLNDFKRKDLDSIRNLNE